MSDVRPVNLSSGLPETVLEPAPIEARHALAQALAHAGDERRIALAEVARAHPRWSEAWAYLGATARDDIEAYAYYRVGYHRGLDALRGGGWRGSGYVRWRHEGNRGVLRALAGLAAAAERIGEADEAERCRTFLLQCDPEGLPADE